MPWLGLGSAPEPVEGGVVMPDEGDIVMCDHNTHTSQRVSHLIYGFGVNPGRVLCPVPKGSVRSPTHHASATACALSNATPPRRRLLPRATPPHHTPLHQNTTILLSKALLCRQVPASRSGTRFPPGSKEIRYEHMRPSTSLSLLT